MKLLCCLKILETHYTLTQSHLGEDQKPHLLGHQEGLFHGVTCTFTNTSKFKHIIQHHLLLPSSATNSYSTDIMVEEQEFIASF
jgi:hypothetical protein